MGRSQKGRDLVRDVSINLHMWDPLRQVKRQYVSAWDLKKELFCLFSIPAHTLSIYLLSSFGSISCSIYLSPSPLFLPTFQSSLSLCYEDFLSPTYLLPSCSLSCPLSLSLLRTSIMYEQQRWERMGEAPCQNSGRKREGKKGREGQKDKEHRHLNTTVMYKCKMV